MFATVTDVKRLQTAINKASTAVNKSESSPIETYLQIAVSNGEVRITGLDSASHQLTMTVPADVGADGVALIKADLAKRYNSLGSQPVNLQMAENNRMLRLEQEFDVYSSPVFGGDSGLFPTRSDLPELKAIIDPNHLRNFIARAKAIREDQEQRLDLVLEGNQLLGYTNSPGLFYRQSLTTESTFTDFSTSVSIHVLGKIQDFSAPVSLHHGEGLLVFVSEEGSFWLRCQDAVSPVRSLDTLFDKDRSGYWITRSNQMLAKLGGILGGRTGVPMVLNPRSLEGKMNLQTSNAVEGSSHVVLGMEDATEDLPTLWLNASSLKTAVGALKTETVMGEYVEHLNRTLVRLTNEDDGLSPRILLLPVNPEG